MRLIYCDLEGVQTRQIDEMYTKEELEPFMEQTLQIYLKWYLILVRSMTLKLKSAKSFTFPFGDFRR